MTSGTSKKDPLSPQSPWPGLRAFTEHERGFFHGRERETTQLLALIRRAAVTLVYGKSGLGKTSLLQAGVFPKLRELDMLPLRIRLDHGPDSPPLRDQIMASLAAALDEAGVKGNRPASGATLWEYFHRRDTNLWGARNRLLTPVVVLDQFEEAFTLGQGDESAAARVAGLALELEALFEHRPPEQVRARLEADPEKALEYDLQREGFRFVFSLREDFLPFLDPWRTRIPSLLLNRFRLEPMGTAQAVQVVERAGGNLVDKPVAQQIVEFVSSPEQQRLTGKLKEEDVEPALLSLVCDELNRIRLQRCYAKITAELISGEGRNIVQGFYERAFDGVNEQVRDWVEAQLLTRTGYRDRAALDDAVKSGLPGAEFDKLIERRILHREERDGVVWLELTHDLLTEPAVHSRDNREQQRQIAEAKEREDKARRELRRSRAIIAGFAVLTILAIAAMIFAFVKLREAKLANERLERAEAAGGKMSVDAIGRLRYFHRSNEFLARQAFNERIASLNQWSDLLILRGNYRQAEENLAESVALLRNPPASLGLRISPGSIADSLERLAEVYFEDKRYPEAEHALLQADELLKLEKADWRVRADLSGRLASLYEHWGKSGKATEWKQKLSSISPPATSARDFGAPAKLLGYWRCEDAQDSAGTNNGILKGGVSITNGANGSGLHFNGIDGGVEIPNAPAPATFTIAAWVRFDRLDSRANVPGSQLLVFRKNSHDTSFEGFGLMKTREEADDKDRFAFELTSAEYDNTKIYTPEGVTNGIPYHLVATFDGSWMRLYLNGAQRSCAFHPYPIDYGRRPMYLAMSGEPYRCFFAGMLDDVAFYDWPLSPEQVKLLYKRKGRAE